MFYDSSLQSMDEPYEIMSNGEATGLVELGIDWTLTETPYLGRSGAMPSPGALFQLYRDEFDGAYALGTTFVLTLHPQVIGHRAPMKYLDQFVAYMKAKPRVWFATCERIARYAKENAD
jgi:peptidoglycan-N-acetylglucosamine deacetylase